MGIWSKLFGKKKEKKLDWPSHFLLVMLTPYALEDGTEDDANKIIIRRFADKYGYYVDEIYRYSKERLHSLQTTYNIPMFDKTEEGAKLPIYARIQPGEIKFITN